VVEKDGFLIQFVAPAINGMSEHIGAVRTNIKTAARIPAYLYENRNFIKARGVEMMRQHQIETQYGNGADEELTINDFSMTYSVRSLTALGKENGATVNNKRDGPVYFLYVPQYVEEWVLPGPPRRDGSANRGFVVNVYLNVLSKMQRYNSTVERGLEAKETGYPGGAPGAKRRAPQSEMSEFWRKKREEENEKRLEIERQMVAELKKVRAEAIIRGNPALPTSSMAWPPQSRHQIPDGQDE